MFVINRHKSTIKFQSIHIKTVNENYMKLKIYNSIVEICNDIDLIIQGNTNITIRSVMLQCSNVLKREFKHSEIDAYCDTIIKVAKSKNRKLRTIEIDLWDLLTQGFLFKIVDSNFDLDSNNNLTPNTEYKDHKKRMISRILGLSLSVLSLPLDKTKSCEKRRAAAIELLAEITNYCKFDKAKELFLASINSNSNKEKYNALIGLENYYNFLEEEMDENTLKFLTRIIKETDDRTIASTCLQIQINTGLLDDFSAMLEMDKWKDEHYY